MGSPRKPVDPDRLSNTPTDDLRGRLPRGRTALAAERQLGAVLAPPVQPTNSRPPWRPAGRGHSAPPPRPPPLRRQPPSARPRPGRGGHARPPAPGPP